MDVYRVTAGGGGSTIRGGIWESLRGILAAFSQIWAFHVSSALALRRPILRGGSLL